jgi:choline dehydrogenase
MASLGGSSAAPPGGPTSRGSNGPIKPRVQQPRLPEVDAFLAAVKGAGIASEVPDYNNPSQSGAGPIQMSVDSSGSRADAFNAFVEPVLRAQGAAGSDHKGGRLQVVSEAFVRSIVLSRPAGAGVAAPPQATHVILELSTGAELQVAASREIICSAGAIGTPQILILSGIGPKSHLDDVGVPCLVDSPAVGSHLQV